MANRLTFLLAWFACVLHSGQSLKCYECARQGFDQNDCTTRDCVGVWCQITIAVDVDEGTKLISKNCANIQPIEFDTSGVHGSCKNIVNSGIQYTICACKNEDYCNNQSTVALILSSSSNTGFIPSVKKKIKCRVCSALSCKEDEAQVCEEQWCIAQIVHNKISNETFVNKKCSDQSHDGKGTSGCINVVESSSEATICACNEEYCTDYEPMRTLIRNHMTAIPAIGSSHITSAFLNGTTSKAASFSISLSIVFLEFWLIMLSDC